MKRKATNEVLWVIYRYILFEYWPHQSYLEIGSKKVRRDRRKRDKTFKEVWSPSFSESLMWQCEKTLPQLPFPAVTPHSASDTMQAQCKGFSVPWCSSHLCSLGTEGSFSGCAQLWLTRQDKTQINVWGRGGEGSSSSNCIVNILPTPVPIPVIKVRATMPISKQEDTLKMNERNYWCLRSSH